VFLQGLLRTVAYGTLSRRARKARHVDAAHYLERAWPGEAADIAEVLASHYQEAIRADPEADDVPELRGSARARLAAAGRSAASLALGPEAARYFEQAAELAEGDLERAELLEQAGRALWLSGEIEGAEARLRSAIELYVLGGMRSGGSGAAALGTMLMQTGRPEEAAVVLEPFRTGADPDTEPAVFAQALATLSSALRSTGERDEGDRMMEQALVTLEAQQAWPALAEALCRKSFFFIVGGRPQEGIALARQALALAEQHDLVSVALRARYGLIGHTMEGDRFDAGLEQAAEAVALARERGDRPWERGVATLQVAALVMIGRWDEATALADNLIASHHDLDAMAAAASLAQVASARGDEALLERCVALADEYRDSAGTDLWAMAALVDARAALDRGDHDQALTLSRRALEAERSLDEGAKEAYWISIDAAVALANESVIDELQQFVADLQPVYAKPMLRAGRARLLAVQAHRRGDRSAADRFEQEALDLLRSVGAKPYIARMLIERARRSDDAQALAEARVICEELGATRWLVALGQASEVTA
jgi:tetratricopeptide (TPR) repeat protein